MLTYIFDTSRDPRVAPVNKSREQLKLFMDTSLLGLEEVKYFSLLLAYEKTPTSTTDLFEFFKIEDINQLKNDKKTILIFDCTFEGYPHTDLQIAQALEYSCNKHQIDPRKMFVFTGNQKENLYDIFVNIIPIFILHLSYNSNSEFNENTINLKNSRKKLEENFNNLILSLSRRNRHHRVLAHFMLSKSTIFNNVIISQDQLESNIQITPDILNKIELTQEDFINFKNQLPMLADGNTFHNNDPFNPLIELHSKTLFSIVNETHVDNFNNKSLFFSEKILKPIVNFQPMIIYGQKNINRDISFLGFKTYDLYFNLDFDSETDNIYRYKKLLKNVTETVNYLKSLSKEQQIEWRYKESDLLQFNYNNFLNLKILEKQITKFLNLVKKIEIL
jgi:hypothetical protein